MYKQGFIELYQVDRFGDITVVWTGIGTGNENMTEIDSYEG
jgi:chromatin segregation and condensation protein Rec8/ScpA/Scc1 (kleisin family)